MPSTPLINSISQSISNGAIPGTAAGELNNLREYQENPAIPVNKLVLQGSLFKVSRGKYQKRKRRSGKRGKVTKFSAKSRARLIEKMLILDWDIIPDIYQARFITLTTTPEYWGTNAILYKKLNNFRRFLFSNGAKQVYIKREYGEENGAHHFHMMGFWDRGTAPQPEVKGCKGGKIQRYWARALGVPDIRVAVEIPECWNHCRRYISKYCTKTAYEGKPDSTREYLQRVESGKVAEAALVNNFHNATKGNKSFFHSGKRWWYIWGQGTLPEAQKHEIVQSYQDLRDMWELRRLYRGVVKARNRKRLQERYIREKGLQIQVYKSKNKEYKLYNLDEKSNKQACKGLTKQRNYLYYKRGSFDGWRIWLNQQDVDILLQLDDHKKGVRDNESFVTWVRGL